jgi:hypothetical protein
MQTLYDFGMEVQKIREAINSLTVKGSENASYVVYAYNKCNDIIKAINEVIERQQNPPESQNGAKSSETAEKEEGEVNGEPDSGTSS